VKEWWGAATFRAAPFVAGPMTDDLEFSHIAANGLTFHVAQAGRARPGEAPVLMLHGFPDLWAIWRRVMVRMAGRFRLIAPDQRGYNLSERPIDRDAYGVDQLLGDIEALQDKLGAAQIRLVGHDWGGVLAWWYALRHPDRVEKLAIINAPHPAQFQARIWDDPAQRAASAYIRRLREEGESLFLAQGVGPLCDRTWGEAIRRGGEDGLEASLYCAAWAQARVWTAMIDWYRAAPFDVPPPDAPAPAPEARWTTGLDPTVKVPALVIWGRDDPNFVEALADDLSAVVPDLALHKIPGGHCPQRDNPDLVADLLAAFFTKS